MIGQCALCRSGEAVAGIESHILRAAGFEIDRTARSLCQGLQMFEQRPAVAAPLIFGRYAEQLQMEMRLLRMLSIHALQVHTAFQRS
mgnify:CR=1 FL=1